MRRRSGLPERVAVAWSTSCWSLVYECTVLMRPCSIVNVSCSTRDHRREAVRRARRVGDHVVLRGVEDGVVHAHADHRVGVAARRGDDHALRATGEVARRGLHAPVKRPVDSMTTSTPSSAHWIAAGSFSPSFFTSGAPDTEKPESVTLTSFGSVRADRVVLQQERHRVGVAERVVHGDELDAGGGAAGEDGSVERPADPSEPVDAHPYGHRSSRISSEQYVDARRRAYDYSRSRSAAASLCGVVLGASRARGARSAPTGITPCSKR